MKQITIDWELYIKEKNQEKPDNITNHMKLLSAFLSELSFQIGEKQVYCTGKELRSREALLSESCYSCLYEKLLTNLVDFINRQMGFTKE